MQEVPAETQPMAAQDDPTVLLLDANNSANVVVVPEPTRVLTAPFGNACDFPGCKTTCLGTDHLVYHKYTVHEMGQEDTFFLTQPIETCAYCGEPVRLDKAKEHFDERHGFPFSN